MVPEQRQTRTRSVIASIVRRRPRVRTWSLWVREAAAATASAAARRERRARERLVQRAAARLAGARGVERVTAQALAEELGRMTSARR
ncbi:hypothetical protein [Kineococcus sp. SYSU DK001]|uniref:hypothetical protein n=1 Tax=Kineococcus sp. SYSU DK001 TaxID=3383122 RepID=UPI003D7DC000